MTNTEQPKKKLTVITYIIALVCLILGLLLPNHDGKMMITTLPSAFAELFSALNITSVPGNAFASSVDVNFFGLITLDIGALAILLYAVITVIGIIMLIPAFACKKKKPVSVCSYTVEIAAFIVLFIYVLLITGNTGLTNYTPSDFANNFPFDWGVICIAFLGTLLMLLIQAVANYKGAGALKIVIWLLGMIGVYSLFTITGLSFIFSEEYGNLGGLFAVADGTHLSGYHFLYFFVQVTFSGNKAVYLLGTSGTAKAASIIIAIAALLAIINFIIDTFALSTKTRKSNVVFDCVRYLLEFVCALIGIILLFAIKEYKAEPGILLYVLVAVSVICADISIVRSAVYKKPKKEPEIAEPAESYYEDDFYGEYEPEPAPAPAP
ncbi:MAG: hypothetical protein LUF82_04010, partial [Clostridia bacterium]|nr:hypothetical protein [Clostridia bacterium]